MHRYVEKLPEVWRRVKGSYRQQLCYIFMDQTETVRCTLASNVHSFGVRFLQLFVELNRDRILLFVSFSQQDLTETHTPVNDRSYPQRPYAMSLRVHVVSRFWPPYNPLSRL